MKLLYISGNYASVQQHLLAGLKEAGLPSRLFSYHLRKGGRQSQLPADAVLCQINSYARGPVLYLHRLGKVAKVCLKTVEDWQPTILHGNMLFADGRICRFISQKTKIPYVISVRNTDLNLWFLWRLPWIRKS